MAQEIHRFRWISTNPLSYWTIERRNQRIPATVPIHGLHLPQFESHQNNNNDDHGTTNHEESGHRICHEYSIWTPSITEKKRRKTRTRPILERMAEQRRWKISNFPHLGPHLTQKDPEMTEYVQKYHLMQNHTTKNYEGKVSLADLVALAEVLTNTKKYPQPEDFHSGRHKRAIPAGLPLIMASSAANVIYSLSEGGAPLSWTGAALGAVFGLATSSDVKKLEETLRLQGKTLSTITFNMEANTAIVNEMNGAITELQKLLLCQKAMISHFLQPWC